MLSRRGSRLVLKPVGGWSGLGSVRTVFQDGAEAGTLSREPLVVTGPEGDMTAQLLIPASKHDDVAVKELLD